MIAKPYLTEKESIAFAGCSRSHFLDKWTPQLEARTIHGKKYYRRIEIEGIFEQAWQLSNGEEKTRTSPTCQQKDIVKAWARSQKNRPSKHGGIS